MKARDGPRLTPCFAFPDFDPQLSKDATPLLLGEVAAIMDSQRKKREEELGLGEKLNPWVPFGRELSCLQLTILASFPRVSQKALDYCKAFARIDGRTSISEARRCAEGSTVPHLEPS